MLMLTRKIGQRIVINGDIVVEVTQIFDTSVRIGIQAPKNVPVDREEVHKAKQQLEKKP